jgi:thioredoxin 1
MTVRLSVLALAVCLAACGGESPSAPAGLPSPSPTPASVVVTLTGANFSAVVLEGGRSGLVDFYLPTCSHCLAMAPVVSSIANEFSGQAIVGQVDVSVEATLSATYQIQYVPTFVFFKNGRETERIVGETTRERLATSLRAALSAR